MLSKFARAALLAYCASSITLIGILVVIGINLSSVKEDLVKITEEVNDLGYTVTSDFEVIKPFKGDMDVLVLPRPSDHRIIKCVNPTKDNVYILTLLKDQVEKTTDQMISSGYTCRYVGGKYFNNERSNS